MRNIKILLLLLVSASCDIHSNIDNKINTRQLPDTNFNSFLHKFQVTSLPLEFSIEEFKSQKKDKDSIKYNLIFEEDELKYVANYLNYLKNNDRMNYIRYTAHSKIEYPEFYVLIYSEFIDVKHNYKIVLATYTKQTPKLISKIVVYSNFELNNLIQSKINDNLEIEIKSIYDLSYNVDYRIDQDHFYIHEFLSKYRILESGEIILIEQIDNGHKVATHDNMIIYKY